MPSETTPPANPARLTRAAARSPRSVFRWSALAVVLALSALLALAACEEEDDDPRPFGPGSGGPEAGASTMPAILSNTASESIGALRYDGGHFTATGPTTPTEANLRILRLVAADGTELVLSLIAGRPDTPCRFTAATAARDEGYTLIGDGEDRLNEAGLEFHEVRMQRGSVHVRLACVQLAGLHGVQVAVGSTSAGQLETRQVHYVLNAIRRLP
jgi:hypothetical protein